MALEFVSIAVAGGGEEKTTGFCFNFGSAAKDSSRALLLGLFAQAVTAASRHTASQVFTAASILVLLVLVVLAGDRPIELPRP